MSCTIEFKSGTFELTEETRQCLGREIEIWEANKLLRELGILPITSLKNLSQNVATPLLEIRESNLLDILNEELVLERLYPNKLHNEKTSLIAILKKENVAQEALLNFTSKLQEYLNVLNQRITC